MRTKPHNRHRHTAETLRVDGLQTGRAQADSHLPCEPRAVLSFDSAVGAAEQRGDVG